MARGASEDGIRRPKNGRQIDPWVKSIPKSGGRNFSIFCLHPNIYVLQDVWSQWCDGHHPASEAARCLLFLPEYGWVPTSNQSQSLRQGKESPRLGGAKILQQVQALVGRTTVKKIINPRNLSGLSWKHGAVTTWDIDKWFDIKRALSSTIQRSEISVIMRTPLKRFYCTLDSFLLATVL